MHQKLKRNASSNQALYPRRRASILALQLKFCAVLPAVRILFYPYAFGILTVCFLIPTSGSTARSQAGIIWLSCSTFYFLRFGGLPLYALGGGRNRRPHCLLQTSFAAYFTLRPAALRFPICRSWWPSSISNKTIEQKSFFSKFFYLFPHKHLQIYTIRKTHDFSTKCASSPY